MKKVTGNRFQVIVLITVFVFLLLYPVTYNLKPTYAQDCGGGSLPRAEGLVTTTDLSGKFGTLGGCIVDPKTAFVPFRIPTYEDLKSLYFNQAKSSKYTLEGDQSGNIDLTTQDKLYYISGNLSLDSPSDISGSKTGVIFVQGNLNIGPISDKKLGKTNSAIVFIVKGDVNIHPSIIEINAVLISEGVIYTAGGGCQTSNVPSQPLVINGSLISLHPAKEIKFCRSLIDNNNPAEIINTQVKYLVILRHLVSDTYQKWSEINPGGEGISSLGPSLPSESISYKRVFVTSEKYDGNLGGIDGATAKCQTRADAASLGGTWKAWLSTDAKSPANQSDEDPWTQHIDKYTLIDGKTKVADNWADLIDGNLDDAIYLSEKGDQPPSKPVWTGTKSDGTSHDKNCSNWTTNGIADDGRSGDRSLANNKWTTKGSYDCNVARSLYCFEQ